MPLHSLPPEIILLIAKHLTSVSDLFNFLRANRQLFRLLFSQIYPKNVKVDGGSALIWYAIHGNEEGVRAMLRAGADINGRSSNGTQSTALLEAVVHNHEPVVRLLLDHGASPDLTDVRARRPLTVAAMMRNDAAITTVLLEHHAKVDVIDCERRAPLMEAVRSNQASKVALLLEHGAKWDIIERRDTMNLLHVAAARNAGQEVMEILIDLGIPIDSQDRWGRTPLQVAADRSCTRAVRLLLQHGANPNVSNARDYPRGQTALFYAAKKPRAARKDNKAIIRALIEHGAQVDATNHECETPLLYAISRGAVEQAQALYHYGANLSARNDDDETVLHLATASWAWCPGTIGWLVESGADVNWVGGKLREPPLFYAIRYSYRREGEGVLQARTLLSFGANVHFQNNEKRTPLSLAAGVRSVGLTRELLEHGALVNSTDLHGRSPLHHVAEATFGPGSHEIITLLLQYGADINCQDNSGYTALHRLLARDGGWEAAGVLLKAGANPRVMSNDGKLPEDMIADGPWAETKRLFIRCYVP